MFASQTPWRKCLLSLTVGLSVAVAPLAIPTAFAQDALAQARSHYQKGNELFSQGNFQAAIGEFAAADKLSHSAMLEYNIALCYDRLGDTSEALRRYRLYLKEMPNASNHATVEGKILRLEGVLRTEAEARRKAEEAARVAPVPPAIPPTPQPPTAAPIAQPPVAEGPDTPSPPPVYIPGGDAEPATPTVTYSGSDPELIRVAAIDVAAIGRQRNVQSGGMASPNESPDGSGQNPGLIPEDGEPKEKEFYKQWWFWVVAGVGVLVVYSIASTDSGQEVQPGTRLFTMPMTDLSGNQPSSGGLQWRF